MGFINENRIRIKLNLKRQYKLMQISDCHVVKSHDDLSVKSELNWLGMKQYFANVHREKYDSAVHSISSISCLNKLIDYCNQESHDLVMLSGDIIDYYSLENYQTLCESLAKFKDKYLFVCGNHEIPSNKYKDISILKNPSVQLVDLGEIFVVGVDNSERCFKQDQLDFLMKLSDVKKPIILCMHYPIITEYNQKFFKENYNDYYYIDYKDCDETTEKFIKFICDNDDVKAIFCGHCHGMNGTYFTNEKRQYVCSSGLIGSINEIIIE